jgi:putative sigma-54 modulation protein
MLRDMIPQNQLRGIISINQMQKNIKTVGIEITPAIASYIEKKFSAFDRFVHDASSASCDIEVGKTTKHHRSGDVFRAEVNLIIAGEQYFAVSEKEDLYAAIDEVRDEIIREITSRKNKSQTMMRRGALRVKNMLKGLDWRKKN